jgi:hypothetical protein
LDFLFEELGEFPLKSHQQKDLESGKGKKSPSLGSFPFFGPMTVAGANHREKEQQLRTYSDQQPTSRNRLLSTAEA